MNDPAFRGLILRCLAAVLLGAMTVAVCYFFIDRPVAFFVHDYHTSRATPLRWATLPPPIAQQWTPFVLACLMVRRMAGPFRRWEVAVIAMCVAVLIADQCKESLRVVFGRYWPETWLRPPNPSLIADGAYGFHPFHDGEAYASFPSGHTARTAAAAAVVWLAWPRWRWLAVLVTLLVGIGLVGMNYHFVGDVVAGAIIGGMVGACTYRCCVGWQEAHFRS